MNEKLVTTDLWCASFILATVPGAQLQKLVQDGKRRGHFAFSLEGENLKEAERLFYTNEQVPVLSLKNTLIHLKHELFEKIGPKFKEVKYEVERSDKTGVRHSRSSK